jgi:hypothetical protein
MQEIFSSLVPVVMFGIVGFAFYSWTVVLISMLRLPSHKKPDIPWDRVPLWGGKRINIFFLPQYLTDKGRRTRRSLILHVFLFVAAVMIPWTIALITVKLGLKF